MGDYDVDYNETAMEDEAFEVQSKGDLFDLLSELLDGWMEANGLELLERYYDHKKTLGKKKPTIQREKPFYHPNNG